MEDFEMLLDVVEKLKYGSLEATEQRELLTGFETRLPGSDILNLLNSDYPPKTILEICIHSVETPPRKLAEYELLDLVCRLMSPTPGTFETEADAIVAASLFEFNCRHEGGTDLLFFPEEYFDGRLPTPEEVVEKALEQNT